MQKKSVLTIVLRLRTICYLTSTGKNLSVAMQLLFCSWSQTIKRADTLCPVLLFKKTLLRHPTQGQ